jgi:3-methyladenine DNA glycosylase AlkD
MEKPAKPYIRLLRHIGDISVWIVDGAWVRRRLDINFTNFGQHHRFGFIPPDEFWLDEEYEQPGEDDFFIRHLLVEQRLMARGMGYVRALAYANRAERAERMKSSRIVRFFRVDSDERRLKLIHKKLLASYGRTIKVWLVDGELVRSWYFIDFTQGGHDKVYPFVPAGEVWIDDDLAPSERALVLLHELHERQLMVAGQRYHPAHDSACELEQRCRRRPSYLSGLIREALRMNAGVGRFKPADRARAIIFELRAYADPRNVAGMVRYGINPKRTLGVGMPTLRRMAKELGRDHRLAARLWASRIHEARILAVLVDDPALVTGTQMDRWAGDFDSWDVCDQACNNLFNMSRLAFVKAARWSRDRREFVRRAGFSLMASLAVHAKDVPDRRFRGFLSCIRRAAGDDRNFVKKAVNWALRQIGKRNGRLRREALRTARELSVSSSPAARWVGRGAVRELVG